MAFMEIKMRTIVRILVSMTAIGLLLGACGSAPGPDTPAATTGLTEDAMKNLVRRSYQYVALFNTINNFAVNDKNPFAAGGWNKTHYPAGLMDASVRALPRPNNDTLYVLSLLDLRKDAVVIHYPAFASRFVSLETSAFDHYCDIPLATSKGDFQEPVSLLYYTARTEGYSGEPVEGVDQIIEMSGDYALAFLRVMPEAGDPDKFKANMSAIQEVRLETLSEMQGKPAKPTDPATPPAYRNDAFVFANNFQEVMQFAVNHTTFDPDNEMDRAALAALETVGVAAGKTFDAAAVPELDVSKLSAVAAEIAKEQRAIWANPEAAAPHLSSMFLPKGKMDVDTMVLQSVVGPIGQPATQAMYPGIPTSDGAQMNAQHDYVIRMKHDELPPAEAFWSATL